ncbi:hypothetical protein MUK42_36156 [Musa troglodytarum]|uniref:Uncharacterized protein n=1 Tax=Musa troglodytarum TaxID=320322 RepID=A0A9E7GWS2_9LILI|nr:hypothetical protein MUK42_36156 [Musa troglodytarum]
MLTAGTSVFLGCLIHGMCFCLPLLELPPLLCESSCSYIVDMHAIHAPTDLFLHTKFQRG